MNIEVPPQTRQDAPPRDGAEPRRHLRSMLLGFGALVLVLGGYYYYSHSGDADRGKGKSVLVPVKVAVAQKRDMAVVENTIGTVVANTMVSVTARVQGQLVTANFKEGQIVKTGDLLFKIDPRPYRAALDQAAGQMARDVASLGSARADARRYASLFAQNAISTQQRDQSQATAQGLEALVASDKAAVETARLNLEFCDIRSPVDGKTGPILLQPGNLVSVNGLTTPLVTITQIHPVKISFSLPQSDLPRIQARAQHGGLTAHIALHEQGGEDVSAPVDFISNAVTNTAGTIELRSTFDNADSALVPGQLVDVTVALANIHDATVVPRTAVNIGPDNQFIFVVDDKHVVEQRPVKVLFDDGVEMAVEGEIHPGEMVVTDGQLRVLPGGKVAISRDRSVGPDNAAKPESRGKKIQANGAG